jgi:hypothetical protein
VAVGSGIVSCVCGSIIRSLRVYMLEACYSSRCS